MDGPNAPRRSIDSHEMCLGSRTSGGARMSDVNLHSAVTATCLRRIAEEGDRRACRCSNSDVRIRDVHGNGIPNGNGNPMGMGINHGIGNGNGREWETTSVGMGITRTPM